MNANASAPQTSTGRLQRIRAVYLVVPLVAGIGLVSAGYMALDSFAESVASTIQPIEGAPTVAAGATEAPGATAVTAIAAQ